MRAMGERTRFTIPEPRITNKKGDKMPENIVLKISGMHCNSCASLIELTLKKEKGVESISVDYPRGEAILQFDSTLTSLPAIEEAIQELGYEVTGS